MNTFLSRSNAVFAFTLSVLAALTAICSLSTAFKDYSNLVPVRINTGKAVVKNVPDYSAKREKNDLGYVTFDLEADFAKVFDWNTKQLFLYLTAHYKTDDNVVNQVVLWDHIMERGDETKIKLQDRNTEYYFWDDGKGLRGNKNITLTLSMNVIPNAGLLPLATSPTTHVFTFPNQYLSSDKQPKS